MTKIILGTAQFGIPNYGIKHDGQPSISEIEKIARIAWDGGIRVIHTSWQYGLPKICETVFNEFEKIWKDKEFPNLFKWNSQYTTGISFYDAIEYRHFFCARQVIVPVNVLDKRFLGRKHNFTVIARSVFLQGLVLMNLDYLPNWLPIVACLKIRNFQETSCNRGLLPYQAALGWVLGLEEVDKVIVGVNSARQLEELLEVKPLQWDYDFSIDDENVLDPRRWPSCV